MTFSELSASSLTAKKVGKPNWIPLRETNLLIIVGVTGVGKSTTVEAMGAGGLSFRLMPNRRELTDHFMIRFLQQQHGETVQPVTDRSARFDYTRRYREQFPGGMGYTLSKLSIDPEVLTADWLIFDGLRGANEVMHAAEHLPNARFLMLDAPDFVRVQRLIKRNDTFDQIQSTSGPAQPADLGNAQTLFSDAEINALLKLVQDGIVQHDDLVAKLEIVKKERSNYDPAHTKMALFHDARDRTIYIDTAKMSVEEAAAFALNKL